MYSTDFALGIFEGQLISIFLTSIFRRYFFPVLKAAPLEYLEIMWSGKPTRKELSCAC